MAPLPVFFMSCALALLACSSFTTALIVEYTFNVRNIRVNRLCKNQVITAVNGKIPGPTIEVYEGDTLVVHVKNQSPYNLTIHWHGILQLFSAWADGPAYVTQCPIRPSNSYTYKFTITRQEGTLWWHSHIQWIRTTVYGALIIRPRSGCLYPFPKPYEEVPILLGQWWMANIIDVENQVIATGDGVMPSDAYTINGQPGDLYPCSSAQTYKLNVVRGKTYLLRIINAALDTQLFFKIANHKLTVVAVDALYTNPYDTNIVVLAPGHTTDVLLTAYRKSSGSYYMAAHPYASGEGAEFDNTTTTGIMVYDGSSGPVMPVLPAFNDTTTAHKFYTSLTGLVSSRFWSPVPHEVDEHMFVTIGLGLSPCDPPNGASCQGPLGLRFAASMNNESFELPTRLSMLEAFYRNIEGIYTTDFPNVPPTIFDYTDVSNSLDPALVMTSKSTKVKKVKFNAVVEVVLQGTSFITLENHPIHLHGFNFHVMAQGFGNYNYAVDSLKFNFVNPQERNTIAVPRGGWAVIRFRANNPGVWLMHCHLDVHFLWGFSMAFVVENGPTTSTRLPPPPRDLPKC